MQPGECSRRLWLDVPFADNSAAKSVGARWDPTEKRWYAPAVVAAHAAIQPWIPIPMALAGEDRSVGSGLFVDLVPRSCWFTNVRSSVATSDWDRLRVMVYRRADYRCEVCGAHRDPGRGNYLEAHERWAYGANRPTQTLTRLICMCTRCNTATHFGLAQLRGQEAAAQAHLMAVNGWDAGETDAHIAAAFDVWAIRSHINWDLDLSMLGSTGVHITAAPTAGQRHGIAAQQTGVQRGENPGTRA